MKTLLRRMNRRGFTAIETMAAVVIMASVGIATSRIIQQSVRASVTSRSNNRATELAQMVIQQYNAYASYNFASLPLYDTGPDGRTPQDFFHVATSMGYDNMTIVTQTSYDDTRTNATVEVTIQRGQGDNRWMAHYRKAYTAALTSQGGGEVAQVYVTVPCPDPACPGVPGIRVSAQSARAGHSVQGVTDQNGMVTLWGLAATQSNQFTLVAPSFSSYTIPSGQAGFAQAYYAMDANGHYVSSVVISTSVVGGLINRIVFPSFSPAGRIHGRVTDQTTGLPLANARVSLGAGAAVAVNGGFYSCAGNADCAVYSAADGTYEFANVSAGDTHVAYDGVAGSDPIVPLGAPGFQQGYTGSAIDRLASDWTRTTYVSQPDLALNTTMNPMQSLQVTVQNQDHSPAAGASVYAASPGLPPTPFRGYYYGFTLTTPASGIVTLYNVFASSYAYISLAVTSSQQVHTQPDWYCTGDCTATPQHATVVLPSGYTFQGPVVDDNPSAAPNSAVNVGFKTYIGGYYIYALSDASSYLSLGRFIGATTDPSQPFWQYYAVSYLDPNAPWNDHGPNGPTITASISGHVSDSVTGAPVPNAPITIMNAYGARSPIPVTYTDSSGNYTLSNAPLYYYRTTYYQTICDVNANVCYPCPTSGSCTVATAQASGQLHIDTRQSQITIVSAGNSSQQGWTGPAVWNVNVTGGQTSTGADLQLGLTSFPVKGIVSYGGQPVGGVQVQDGVSGASVVSGDGTNGTTLGEYTLWCQVQNRTPGNTGRMVITVPAQGVNGQSFASVSNSPNVPTPADINTPLQQDLSLSLAHGGGI